MVLALAETLEVPLRDRNALLEAAGYAPVFRETGLSEPEMREVRRAVHFLLDRHEPNPAIALDRHWNVLRSNQAARRLVRAFGSEPPELSATNNAPNLLRFLCAQDGLQPHIANWEEVSAALLRRLMREATTNPTDGVLRGLAKELRSHMPVDVQLVPEPDEPLPLVVKIHLRSSRLECELFTTVTTLGTPLDITLQELRIESLFPVDEASEIVLRSLATGESKAHGTCGATSQKPVSG